MSTCRSVQLAAFFGLGALCAAQGPINGLVPNMVNSGTPRGVPASYDCSVREHAWEFGKATLPSRGSFKTLFDALQLQHCNVSNPPTELDEWKPPNFATPTGGTALYVAPDAAAGGDGSLAKPFATLADAVAAAAGKVKATILLRAGVHHSGELLLTVAHKGLTVQNYQGEHAVLSGGVPIEATKADWKPYKVAPALASVPAPVPLPKGWTLEEGYNNVFGRAKAGKSTGDMVFLGKLTSWGACVAAMETQNATNGPFNSLTWHTPGYSGKPAAWDGDCYGVTGTEWTNKKEAKIVSAKGPYTVPAPAPGPRPPGPPMPPPPPPAPPNIWVLDLSTLSASAAARAISEIRGLRVNGGRGIRAKYPNGNPELSGPDAVNVLTYRSGWVTGTTEWLHNGPGWDRWNETMDDIANAADWPGVNWPMVVETLPDSSSINRNNQGGEGVHVDVAGPDPGACGDFHIGHGGFCNDLNDPSSGDTGYWCSQNPPRGQCYNPNTEDSKGCTQTHMAPDGLKYTDALLPHAKNYSNITGAVVQAWRCVRWFTNLCLVDSMNKETGEIFFDSKVGCNQGGEGCVRFAQWWIENVLEELDAPGEWFFNDTSRKLFYFFNSTSPPTGDEKFVATKTKVLFNISGSQEQPVQDVTIRGLEIRDTAYTYLGTDKADLHGMPSGGDWALQRSGAILLEGTERIHIVGCHLTRIDGNGIFLSNYNRNATIASNEMSWVGDGAIAAWGSTSHCLNANCTRKLEYAVGPDARGGNQPRGTHVVGNLVREIGLWQKQSSMWFQATTMQSHIERNVHFNGPRAGLNFNDGMGGGDIIEGNLLTNCVLGIPGTECRAKISEFCCKQNMCSLLGYITDDGMIRDDSLSATGPGLPGHVDAKGKPSIVPKFREIRKNFIIGLYNSQEDIDTDDGSSYYQTHDNYFAMAEHGLKSDFEGQWNHHWNNIYGYVGSCFGEGPWLAFYNNTCITTGNGFGCPHTNTMSVYDNKVYGQGVKACNGTTGAWPADDTVKGWATQMLLPFPLAVEV